MQRIIGGIIVVLAFIAPLIAERLMSAAPTWAWRLVFFGAVVLGIAVIFLSDQVFPLLRDCKHNIAMSIIIILIAGVFTIGSFWLFLVVGWPSEPPTSVSQNGPNVWVKEASISDLTPGQSVKITLLVE